MVVRALIISCTGIFSFTRYALQIPLDIFKLLCRSLLTADIFSGSASVDFDCYPFPLTEQTDTIKDKDSINNGWMLTLF